MTVLQSTNPRNTVTRYCRPLTLPEALRDLADGPATVLAGGTDLMVQGASGRIALDANLVNIRRIPELRGIASDNGRIRIGTLVTMTELQGDPVIGAKAPVLAVMVDKFASNQIRNMATLGGNICNASPAGDAIQPLLVLDAEIELASWNGNGMATRSVPIAEFFTGPGKTVRAANELVTGVSFAEPPAGFVARFAKSGPRPALEISTVSMALGGIFENNTVRNVRMSFGAVAPTPVRARRTEAFLEGKVLDEETVRAAAETAAQEVTPIDDVRASAWYRRHLVGVFARRMIRDVCKG